jgi:transposase
VVARALSKELREKIVSAYERGAGTIPEVANIFGISERSVARYLQIHP